MDDVIRVLQSKTFWAGVGLCGLGVYQLTQQNYEGAYQSVVAACAVWGLRHAVSKVDSPRQ